MQNKKAFLIIFITSLIIIIFLSFFKNMSREIESSLSYFTTPVMQTFSGGAWWFKDKWNLFKSIGTLKEKNQTLFEDNLLLQSKLARLKQVEKENDIFRKELKLAPREKYNLEPALVIGRKTEDASDGIYINKGLKDGVQKDMAVLVGKGILIGKTTEVLDKISRVQLVTNNNFKVNAKVVESEGQGIVIGQYGISVVMKMIPQTIELKKGDMVVTSELSNFLPADILIGYIQEISTTEDELFQEASVLLPRELDQLYLVWVLKK